MTFLIIAICLLAERFLLEQEGYRQHRWFDSYLDRLQQFPLTAWAAQRVTGVILLLAPPLLAVGLLQALFDDLWGGIPQFIFATAVLLFSLGPRDLDRQVNEYIDAREAGERDKARDLAQELCGDEPPETEPSLSRAVALGILEQACYRIFGVLFWFILLGPLGAVIYRLSRTLQQTLVNRAEFSQPFHDGVKRLLEILDWVPARLTAAAYALSGSFEDAVLGWRDARDLMEEEPTESAGTLLAGAGGGALGLEESWPEDTAIDAPAPVVEAALGLVWRALLVWAGLLGLATLSYWVA
jgi:membrane protein required for beta-lactamase induction